MKSLEQFKTEQMQNSEFAKEYEALQPEFDVIREIIEERTSFDEAQKELIEE